MIKACNSAEMAVVPNPKQSVWMGEDLWSVRTGEDIELQKSPSCLSARQFWLAVEMSGLTSQIKMAVAASPAFVQIEVEKATEFLRSYPMLSVMAAEIGKTDSDIDALFALGATL